VLLFPFLFFLPEFDNAAGHLTFPQINEHHVATANVRVLADTLFLDVVEVTSFVFPNAPPQPEEHGGGEVVPLVGAKHAKPRKKKQHDD